MVMLEHPGDRGIAEITDTIEQNEGRLVVRHGFIIPFPPLEASEASTLSVVGEAVDSSLCLMNNHEEMLFDYASPAITEVWIP